MLFRKRTAVLLLIAIGILVYFQVIRNGFILGDDTDQILQNTHVHSISYIPKLFSESTYYSKDANRSYGLFYRPMMLSMYTILYSFFGPNPGIFHLFQLLLHIANAVIVFFIMDVFFPIMLAFFIACIFLVHPINSETVVHAANLQDTLFFFFGGLALLTVMKHTKQSFWLKGNWKFLVFLLLSVFSKETGFLFGFMSLMYVWLYARKQWIPIAVCVGGIFLIYSVFRFGIARVGFGESPISPISQADVFIRILTMPAIVVKYLGTFLFPATLENAQFWLIRSVAVTGFIIPTTIVTVLLILTSLAGIWIARYAKENLSVYIFFTIWFLSGLVIHLHIVPLDATVAYRWFYFPIVGLLGMLSSVYVAFFYRYTRVKKILSICCLIIIVLLAYRTYICVFDWRDSETFYTRELQQSPHNFLIENNLANIYIDNGQYHKAQPLLENSVKQYPYFANLNNTAIFYAHDKNIPKANTYFLLTLQRGSSYTVYKNYANFLLYIAKDYKKADQVATQGIALYPGGSELYLTRAQAKYYLNNYDQALKDAEYTNGLLSTPLSREVLTAIRSKREIRYEKYIKIN